MRPAALSIPCIEISEILRVDFRAAHGALSDAMKAYVDVALVVWNPDIIQLLSFVLQTKIAR